MPCTEIAPNHVLCGTEPKPPQEVKPGHLRWGPADARDVIRLCDEARMSFVAAAFVERDTPLADVRKRLVELRRADRVLSTAPRSFREDRQGLLMAAARDDRAELVGRLILAKLTEWDEETAISSHLPPDVGKRAMFTAENVNDIYARRKNYA